MGNFYRNIPEILAANAKTSGGKPLLWSKQEGIYAPHTTSEVFASVMQMAYALSSMGVTHGSSVALISGNRPEWVVADLGILSLGAVCVPVYPTLHADDIAYILNDCSAPIVIVENQVLLDRVRSVMDRCSSIHSVVVMDGEIDIGDERCHYFSELLDAGRLMSDQQRQSILDGIASVAWDDLASIVYTSGTTGKPKGVMLSHGNFISNVMDVCRVLPLSSNDVVLSFLPLSHVFERTAGYYTILVLGASIYYAESIDTVGDDIRLVKPTVLVSVPRLYEKIQSRIYDGLSGIKRPLFYWALGVGRRYVSPRKSRSLRLWDQFLYAIANHLVFSKVRSRTGGNIRFFVSGGAPLGKDLGEFYHAMGLLIIEGYGLTEASPIIGCNRVDAYRFGSIGLPLPSMECKLKDDGELLVRGPNVMKGYLHLEKETEAVLDEDGWLSTGDIAQIDDDGFIWIIDRKKELLILSNGKNVAPQPLAQVLLSSRFISQVLVLGNNRRFVSALIVPNEPALRTLPFCAEQSMDELCRDSRVLRHFGSIIKRKMHGISGFKQVKRFVLLPNELTQENGELTPSLKIKRAVVLEKYHAEIDAMYAMKEDD